MRPGEKHEGWLCFTTSIGEYKLPFVIRAQKEEIKSVAGKVTDLDSFVNIAKDDFREALGLFYRQVEFRELLDQKDKKQMALYKGLSRQPVTFQHLEEFLISTGKKKPLHISLKTDSSSFYDIRESVRESFLYRGMDGDISGWTSRRREISWKYRRKW